MFVCVLYKSINDFKLRNLKKNWADCSIVWKMWLFDIDGWIYWIWPQMLFGCMAMVRFMLHGIHE